MPDSIVRRSVLLAVLIVATLAGCGSASTPTAQDTGPMRSPGTDDELLFVARSEAGSLDVRPDATSTLELRDVDAVTWFTDRPVRDAGTISVTDALKTFGWERNGDRVDDDAPNAALVADELGSGSVIIELLTATVDAGTVRFTVGFIGSHPASTALSDVGLFIDDTDPVDTTLLPSGLELRDAGGIVLGRTTDDAGRPHSLVLHLAPSTPGIERAVAMRPNLFAVATGTSTYAMTGDVAVGGWRFTVDPSIEGDAAPIVVLKSAPGSLAALAADPRAYADPSALTGDVTATTVRLQRLIGTVTARAHSGEPDAPYYARLHEQLADPTWMGVLVFNAAVPEVPAEVQGRSTAALAGTPIPAFAIGFTFSPLGSANPGSSFFGTIDLGAGGTTQPNLRARFDQNELADFSLSTG